MNPGDAPQLPGRPEGRVEEIPEFDRLIHGHLEGELTDQEYARLEGFLAQGRPRQQRFLRMCSDHQALRIALARSAASTAAPRRRRRRASAVPPAYVRGLAMAALLVIGLGGWLISHRFPPRSAAAAPDAAPALGTVVPADPLLPVLLHLDGTVALMRNHREVMLQEGMQLVRGDELDARGEGHAEMRYGDGSLIRIPGPSRIVVGAPGDLDPIQSGKYLTLVSGRISAEFAHHDAQRACIATQESLTNVIGTHLDVERAGRETCTTVTTGEVQVVQRSDQQTIAISAGQCALIAPGLPCRAHAIGEPFGRRLMVGAGQTYPTLFALPTLAPGDEVDVMPGSYRGGISWDASGTALRPIVIRGVGGAPSVIDGTGIDLSGVGAIPRALFQISGDHYRIEQLSFINARNQSNAAAIRTLGATTIAVEHCRISRCDDGIFTVQGSIDVGDCEVGFCGTPEHQSLCHELYLSGDEATIHGCYIHDALFGQAIKCASHYVELISNRIGDADDGEISFIDGPETTRSDSNLVLIGNAIISKPDRRGNHQRFISIAAEAGGQRTGNLYLISNTFVARDPRVVFLDIANCEGQLSAQRNIFFGSDRILEGQVRKTDAQDNWLPPDHQAPVTFIGAVQETETDRGESEPGFYDAEHGNYHLHISSRSNQVPARRTVYRNGSGVVEQVGAIAEPPDTTMSPGRLQAADRPVIGAFAAVP